MSRPPEAPAPRDGASASWRPAPPSHRTADLDGGSAARDELAAGMFFGRFRVERLLGQGGMGRVYEARDASLERPVALKVLRAEGGANRDAAMRRILREARAVAALRHENVVSIYEAGEVEGTPYIAMELLEGAPLRRYVGAGGVLPERKLAWALDVARALAAAHEAGLVHRDVKPENVFVCEGVRAKLLDFGVAARDQGRAEAGAPGPGPGALGPEGGHEPSPPSARPTDRRAAGTPRYMPPEQLAGRAPDARSDQYAWALTTYELLCGTHEGAAAKGAAARLLASAPGLSSRAAEAVERCLRPDPASRFASMRDVIAEMTEAPAAATPGALAPGPSAPSPGRPRRAALARAGIALAAAGALAALIAGLSARGVARRLAPPCAIEGPEEPRLNGPVPDALLAISHDADLVLYGTFADASIVSSGVARSRVGGAGGASAFEPFEPFMQVVPPEGRRLAAASWQGEDMLAVYSDSLGSVGVWGPRGPVSALRLDHASLGLATAVSGDALVGVSLGLAKGGSGGELVAFSMRADAGPKREAIRRAGPGSPLSPPAVAAAGGHILVAFTEGDRLLALMLDDQLRREGEPRELARGPLGTPAAAPAGPSAFVVAWPERPAGGGPAELRAAALPLDGRPAGPTRSLGPTDTLAPALALAPAEGGAVAAWSNPSSNRVLVRALSADASPATEALTFDAAGGVRSIAASPRKGGAWVAWIEGGPGAHARASALRCDAGPR